MTPKWYQIKFRWNQGRELIRSPWSLGKLDTAVIVQSAEVQQWIQKLKACGL